ncbi:MAG: hypothetical protein JWQ09_1784 [Segetibacter sp.]|nr:hypothetical protein [Segetibacter sp.]
MNNLKTIMQRGGLTLNIPTIGPQTKIRLIAFINDVIKEKKYEEVEGECLLEIFKELIEENKIKEVSVKFNQ